MSIVLDGSNVSTTGVPNSGTAKNATGTAIDFTGIPAGTKRITVMFNGVSTNGTSILLVQIGDGAVNATGYIAQAYSLLFSGAVNATSSITTGFNLSSTSAAADVRSGHCIITNITGNTWVSSSNLGALTSGAGGQSIGSGNKALSGTLDRVRITTVNGTDTFDAGSINILYE